MGNQDFKAFVATSLLAGAAWCTSIDMTSAQQVERIVLPPYVPGQTGPVAVISGIESASTAQASAIQAEPTTEDSARKDHGFPTVSQTADQRLLVSKRETLVVTMPSAGQPPCPETDHPDSDLAAQAQEITLVAAPIEPQRGSVQSPS